MNKTVTIYLDGEPLACNTGLDISDEFKETFTTGQTTEATVEVVGLQLPNWPCVEFQFIEDNWLLHVYCKELRLEINIEDHPQKEELLKLKKGDWFEIDYQSTNS